MDSDDKKYLYYALMLLIGFIFLISAFLIGNADTNSTKKSIAEYEAKLKTAKLEACKEIESDSAREGCIWAIVADEKDA